MASVAGFDKDDKQNAAAEQNVLFSLLEANQKICSLLEVLVNDAVSLGRTGSAANKLGLKHAKPEPMPVIGRVLLQNDFALPENSYPQVPPSKQGILPTEGQQASAEYLPAEEHNLEQLRNHLNRPYWFPAVRKVLGPLLDCAPFKDNAFMRDVRFKVPCDDLARLLVCVTLKSGEVFRTRPPLPPAQRYSWQDSVQEYWDDLRTMNSHGTDQGPFVGRLVVLREPAPLKLAILHLVLSRHFDMDSIFAALSTPDPTSAHLQPTSDDFYGKRQRNFVFAFRYFTVVNGSRSPSAWQTFDSEEAQGKERIPISSCSSVVALSLAGEPVRFVEKVIQGRLRKYPVYDPFAPWQVFVVNFFPDLHTTWDVYTTQRRLVNGPEAFLRAVLAQYRDAQKRFTEITAKVIALTTLGVSIPRFRTIVPYLALAGLGREHSS